MRAPAALDSTRAVVCNVGMPMVSARLAVLIALVVPAGARAASDEPEVTVDEASAGSQPEPEPQPVPPPAPRAAQAEPRPVTAAPAAPSAPAIEGPGVAEPVAAPRAHAGTGIGLELGYARGGEQFATLYVLDTPAVGINGGDGASVSLTGNWTPLWREGLGLGAYASAGIKYAHARAFFGSVSFTRYPVAAAAQVQAAASDKWFVIGRAGLLVELGGQLSGGGLFAGRNSHVATTLGAFADAGVQVAFGQHLAVAVVARYTYMDIPYGGSTASANSLGAVLGFSFTR